jgi:hypothetical protein
VILLTHCISGSLGVSKTLTAELLAEHLQRALTPVSAGELGTTAEAVKQPGPNATNSPRQYIAYPTLPAR